MGYYLNVHTQPYQQHAFLKDRDTYVSFDYPGSEATFAYGINDDWEIVGSYRDASGLYHGFLATPVPLPSAEQILSFFDTAVSNGTLTGEGPGKSGDGRLKALRNMIEAASNLIAVGNLEEAYQQLVDAYKKTDGDSHIPDFVEGEATAELAQMILALENSLMQTTSLALAASITSHNPLPPSVWLFGSGLVRHGPAFFMWPI